MADGRMVLDGLPKGYNPPTNASANVAIGNSTCPSLGKCKNRPFISTVTVTIWSMTMSCHHHADFVSTF